MANEITINVKISVSKSNLVHSENPGTINVDMTGTTAIGGAATTTTTGTALPMGSVSSAGYAYFRNTDTTNSIDIGTGAGGSFVAFHRLKPGEASVLRLGTNAPTVRSTASTPVLQYYILAD